MDFKLTPFRETPYNLQFTFVGKMWEMQYDSLFTGQRLLRFRTGATQIVHFTAKDFTASSSYMVVTLHEASTCYSTTGSLQVPTNVDRRSSNVSTIYSMDLDGGVIASSSSGTIIERLALIKQETCIQRFPELILKSDTEYAFRFTSGVGAAANINANFAWYESDN